MTTVCIVEWSLVSTAKYMRTKSEKIVWNLREPQVLLHLRAVVTYREATDF